MCIAMAILWMYISQIAIIKEKQKCVCVSMWDTHNKDVEREKVSKRESKT